MDMVESTHLTKYACNGLLESARRLSSNTEKSKVLRAVAKTKFIKDKDIRTTYKMVAKTLSSDSEYRNVMDAMTD